MKMTLKALRVNRGWSQAEAAKEIGVHTSTLQKYESGKSQPNVSVIKRIESAYGVGYDNINFFAQ